MPTKDAPEFMADANRPTDLGGKSAKPVKISTWIVIAFVGLLIVTGGVWLIVDSSMKRDVPNLVGDTLPAAEETLTDLDLALIVESDVLPGGIPDAFVEVVAQSPAAGSRVYAGEQLVVSVEPIKVPVPDLVDKTYAQAEADLEAAGLTLERVNSIPEEISGAAEDAVSMWTVQDQSVQAGADVDAGTGISLSLDIPNIEVPVLTLPTEQSTSPEAAQSSFEKSAAGELSRALLQPEFSGSGSTLLSMSPAPGDSVPAFTKVTVTLGIPMPDIVAEKLSASAASEVLSELGFTNVTQSDADNTVIVGQNFAPGTVIASDAAITLENNPKGYTYRVTGDGLAADISWSKPGSFDIQQANGTSLPWERTFETSSNSVGVLTAFMSDGGGEITCQIVKDGVVVKENTSTGPYALVTCG